MTTTTDYGSWYNHHGDALTPEEVVGDYIGGGDADWRQRVEASGAFERMVSDYRDAVQAGLPEGVYLTGSEFIGPFYDRPDGLDIRATIEGVDLAAIVERHDPDTDRGDGLSPQECTDRQLAVRVLLGREWNPRDNEDVAELYRRHPRIAGIRDAVMAAMPPEPEDADPLAYAQPGDFEGEGWDAYRRVKALLVAEVTAIRDRV